MTPPPPPIELALFEPDIPQNVGAAMRLCACLDVTLHIIEPCGFLWQPRKIQQAGMDYMQHARYQRHDSWDDFLRYTEGRRLVLMTTKSAESYYDFTFAAGDILVAGSESTGAPTYVHEAAGGRICIPMHGAMRSLNVINASAMIVGEALRQAG